MNPLQKITWAPLYRSDEGIFKHEGLEIFQRSGMRGLRARSTLSQGCAIPYTGLLKLKNENRPFSTHDMQDGAHYSQPTLP